MERVREVIVVEGRYDKITLSQIVDAVIIETSGFAVFNDREKQALLHRLAEAKGLVVLTDSDGAGFMIRNFIRGCVDPQYIKNAYIPDIVGKERRKSAPSKGGCLGVEGMRPDVLLRALRRAGATFEDGAATGTRQRISKADLYVKGLSGGQDSAQKRAELINKLDLPSRLTATGLLDVLNVLMTRDEFLSL